VDGVEHLAFADSQWRWFFGVDPEDVTNQPTDCDLGATADQPVAGEDSITYVNHRCPAGMTRDDFDPSDCSPDPHAIRWELSGSTLDRPLTWEDVTTTGGPEYTWDLLSYGDYQVSADQLPEDAPDVVFSDDGVTPQATGYAVTLDADQPHVRFDDYVLPSDDPAAQRGSIEVDFYDCPKGMTAATFDPNECSPSTAGSHGYVLSPCPDVDLCSVWTTCSPSARPGTGSATCRSAPTMSDRAIATRGSFSTHRTTPRRRTERTSSSAPTK